MKTQNQKFKLSLVAVAVASALSSMAYAEEDEAAALKTPTNTIEIGGMNSTANSTKFGEYSDINRNGIYGIGNINIRGGSAYGPQSEQGGTYRWFVNGSDLGLDSRAASVGIADQGAWSISVMYDEMKHYLTSGYKTPYSGTVGGNSWTLAGPMSSASTSLLSSTTPYNPVDVATNKKNSTVSGTYQVSPSTSFTFDYNHLDQTGAKLQGFGTQTVATTSGVNGATSTASVANIVALLPVPTNWTTDNINLAMNWSGDKFHYSVGYFGSFFRNKYNQMSVTPEVSTGTVGLQYLSLQPNNDFNQLFFNGGYDFSSKTKLVGNFSLARNTQNDPFVNTDTYVGAPPVSSMNGLVNTYHADLKLTDKTTNKLTLAAGLKYDERDNLSAAHDYIFASLDGQTSTTSGAKYTHIGDYSNTPLSTRKSILMLNADYKIDSAQSTHVNYEHESLQRWCNQYAAAHDLSGTLITAGTNPSTINTSSNLIASSVNANCALAPRSVQDKIELDYKLKFQEAANWKIGYAFSNRNASMNSNAYASFIGTAPGTNTGSNAVFNPVGPYYGQNAGNYTGFYPAFESSRIQNMVKSSLNWDIGSKLSFGLSGRYSQEHYGDDTYGVKNGSSWATSFDATFAYSQTGSVYLYATDQHRQRAMTSFGTVASTSATSGGAATFQWNNNLNDDDFTVGLGAKQSGLMSGKVTLASELAYSIARTGYSTDYAYNYTATPSGFTGIPGASACTATNVLSASCSLPDIRNEVITAKLSAAYQIDKPSKIVGTYMYQRLNSSDYFYNAYAFGTNPYSTTLTSASSTVVPNGLNSGNYRVSLIAVSYVYSFQ